MIVEVPRCGERDTNFRIKIINNQTNEACVTGYTDFADAQDGNEFYSLKNDRLGNCTSIESVAGEGPEKLRVVMEAFWTKPYVHDFATCANMVIKGYFRLYKTDDSTIGYISSKRSTEQMIYGNNGKSMEFYVFLIAVETASQPTKRQKLFWQSVQDNELEWDIEIVYGWF